MSTSHTVLADVAVRDSESQPETVVVFDNRIPEAVASSLHDRDRICPAFCGVGLVDRGQLHLRLPTGELHIQAPIRLLRRVFSLCDGQHTFNEILEQESADRREELGQFMVFLFDQGALVDSIYLTQKTAAFGFQTTPVGQSAPQKATGTLATRFTRSRQPIEAHWTSASDTPLSSLLQSRSSSYTFDENTPVTTQQLSSLLWSTAGVVSEVHPRLGTLLPLRATGSGGGMYLVRWFVLLLRPVDGRSPGVYEVSFPAVKKVAWRQVSADVTSVLRAYLKPWQLIHATGAIVAAGDVRTAALRYRNRALQYLLIEAGASFQNLSLAAPALGLASSIIGGYSDEHIKSLCNLEDEFVLGSAIFGTRPTAAQSHAVRNDLPIDFVWSDAQSDVYPLRSYAARARLAGHATTEYDTFGKDTDPLKAYVKAHAETLERQGAREVANVSVALYGDLETQISPELIARYSERQYQSRSFPYERFDPKKTYHWVPGTQLSTGRRVHVPGDFVYGHPAMAALEVTSGACIQANSSGCAAGPTLEFALEAALLETIERDAFMRHWFSQTSGRWIADTAVSGAALQRLHDMRNAGCTVTLQTLTSAAAEVVLASATHHERHFTCVAGAARFDRIDAVDAALDELEISVYTRLIGQHFDPVKPQAIRDPGGHALLYAQKAYYKRAERVLSPVEPVATPSSSGSARNLDSLVATLKAQDLESSYVDITPAKHCINQGRTALKVVKVIVPGLIPISFGFEREPRAMVAKIHRGAFLPHPFP